ncbi:hypothetical protein SteCoe_15332 [Stentor coeruleus]|uniref:Uncharacterized protein n=1 Tax=Stentor coeruleus TaxID=5963 RepID=A0A1R2C406_9CILI|nr:hypothetical protein SteCoe_15332 [Stentor coeruleus]
MELPERKKRWCSRFPDLWENAIIWLLLLIFSVMLGSLCTPRWVQQGKKGSLWRGSLLRCGGCDGEWEDKYYWEIAEICEENNIKGYHETFRSLYIGGVIFLVFQIITLGVFTFIILARFGWFFKIKSMLYMNLIMIFALISQTVAVSSWFIANKAKFGNNCDVSSGFGENKSLCPTQGPILAVCSEIGVIMILMISQVVGRKNDDEQKISPASQSDLNSLPSLIN